MVAAAVIAAVVVLGAVVALALRQLARGLSMPDELHEGDAIEHSRPLGNVRKIDGGK